MTPSLLIDAGRALYGADWRTPLALALRLNVKTITRWAAGEYPINPGIRDDLIRLIEQHHLDVSGVRFRLFAADPQNVGGAPVAVPAPVDELDDSVHGDDAGDAALHRESGPDAA